MLSDGQVDEFFERGYIVVPELISSAEIGEMAAAFEELARMVRKLEGRVMHRGARFVVEQIAGRARIRQVSWCGAAVPLLLRHGGDNRLLAIAARLLGSGEMNQ